MIPRTPRKKYIRDPFTCGACGHSVDMHNALGKCRVHKLSTGKVCDCKGFTQRINNG